MCYEGLRRPFFIDRIILTMSTIVMKAQAEAWGKRRSPREVGVWQGDGTGGRDTCLRGSIEMQVRCGWFSLGLQVDFFSSMMAAV